MSDEHISQRTIEEVFDMETGQIIESKEFFTRPESEIFNFRRRLELAIQGYAAPKFVCLYCNQLLKLSGKSTLRGHVSFFAHLYDSDECEIKTDGTNKLNQKEIEILKYSKCRESQRHKDLKHFIYNSLIDEKSQLKGVENVNIEKRIFTRVPYYNWRQPDISFNFHGSRVVIELQLSTTFLGVVVERDVFYKMNNTFIIWVFNFSDNQQFVNMGNMMCKDIYYSNKRNAFVLDEEAMVLSLQRKELILKCIWFEPKIINGFLDITKSIRKEEFISLDQLKYEKENFKPYYIDSDSLFGKFQQNILFQRTKHEKSIEKSIHSYLMSNDEKLYPFEIYGRWGYKNERNEYIIQPKYFEVVPFKYGISWVREKFWGAINTKGRRVVNFEFLTIEIIEDIDLIIAQNKSKRYGVLSIDGYNIIPFEYSLIEYSGKQYFFAKRFGRSGLIDIKGNVISTNREQITDKVYKAEKFELWGMEDTKGKVILPFEYDRIEKFVNGFAVALKEGRTGLIDIYGKELIEERFKLFDSRFIVKRFELWGIENELGDIIAEFEYSELVDLKNGVLLAKKFERSEYETSKYGFLNYNGEIILPFVYDSIENFHNDIAKATKGSRSGLIHKNGYEVVQNMSKLNNKMFKGHKFGLWGLFDKNGLEILPYKYPKIEDFSGEYAFIQESYNHWGVINSKGEVIIPPNYSKFGSINENKITANLDNKWGIIDDKNTIVCDFEYSKMVCLCEGYLAVEKTFEQTEKYTVRKKWNGRMRTFTNVRSYHETYWGVCDFAGKIVIPLAYSEISMFDEKKFAAKKGYQWGVLSVEGEQLIPFEYDNIGQVSEGQAFAVKNDNWGSINLCGEVLIPFEFQFLGNFKNGRAIAQKNNYWGFIDTNGSIVIPFEYYEICEFYNGKAKAKKHRKFYYFWGYIDEMGNELIPFEFDIIEEFNSGKAKAKKDGKWGYIDDAGIVLIPLEYDIIEEFNGGKAKAKKDGKWGYIDDTGHVLIPFEYSVVEPFINGKAKVEKNNRNWGYVDRNGDVIIPCEYSYFGKFIDGKAIVKKNNKWGYINENGKEIVPAEYEKIETFNKGRLKIMNHGKWGYFDDIDNICIPCEYQIIEDFIFNRAKVKKNDKWGYIDKKGKEIIPCKFDIIEKFISGRAKALKGNKWGYIDIDGNELFESETKISDGIYKCKIFGLWGLNLTSGENLLPFEYNVIDDFIRGKARVMKEGKWGLIDDKGNIVVPIIYESIEEFNDGKAKAKRDHRWGVIDENGDVSVPFAYDIIDEFLNGIAKARKGTNWGYIDLVGNELVDEESMIDEKIIKGKIFDLWGLKSATGKIILPYEYEIIDSIVPGKAKVKKNGKWGYLEIYGNQLIECKYDAFVQLSENLFAARENTRWGCCNSNGDIVLSFSYDAIKLFANDRFMVKKNGLWGIISMNEDIIIDLHWDNIVGRFEGGLLAIKNFRFEKIAYDTKAELLKLKIKSIIKSGVFLNVFKNLNGFLPFSLLNNDTKERNNLRIGDYLYVYIKDIAEKKNTVTFCQMPLYKEAYKKDEYEFDINVFNLGSVYKGKIVNIKPFGLFIRIQNGVTGLLHVSEMKKNNRHITEFTRGEELDVKIDYIDKEKKRITFTYVVT